MGILDEGHDHDDSTYVLEEEAKTDESVSKRTISIFDPKVRTTVKTTWKGICRLIIPLMIGFVFLLSLFYGLAWNPRSNWGNLQLAVCDLDGGIIGATIVALATNQSVCNFTVTVLPGTNSMAAIQDLVNRGRFNAALVANPSASATLLAALRNASAAYAPAAATSFVFDEGRGGSSLAVVLRLVVPTIAAALANAAVSEALFQNLSSPAVGAALSTVNAAALLNPVGNTEVNLHRIQYSGENSLIGLGAARTRARARFSRARGPSHVPGVPRPVRTELACARQARAALTARARVSGVRADGVGGRVVVEDRVRSVE